MKPHSPSARQARRHRYAGSFLAALALSFATCATPQPASGKAVDVTGTVEKICESCDIADLINGNSLEWDVVAVRIVTPDDLSGTTVSLKVLVEDDGTVQRASYRPTSRIAFSAAPAALAAKKVMLHAADVKAAE